MVYPLVESEGLVHRRSMAPAREKWTRVRNLVFGLLTVVATFAMVPPARSEEGSFTTLVAFSESNGSFPAASLIQAGDGNFYGVTDNNYGTIFKMAPDGVVTTLLQFNGLSGSFPRSGSLIEARDGNLYGTTEQGGSGYGTVFKLNPLGELTTLVTFSVSNGANPYSGVIQANDGNFYGTTVSGGANNMGTVFRLTPSGELTTIAAFNGLNGSKPYSRLIQASDGNLYGTTSSGGSGFNSLNAGYGTVFKLTLSGELSTLISFDGYNGVGPVAGLIQAGDGDLYGTTSRGGPASVDYGTAFKLTLSGAFKTLATFRSNNGFPNGAYPRSSLVQASDGNFYGTTASGGINGPCITYSLGCGTVFRMTPSGTLSALVYFDGQNGGEPLAALIQASDGALYGTTSVGGPTTQICVFGCGTVFKLLPTIGPTPPAGLAAIAASGQVTLNWDASPGAISYTVYQGLSADSESTNPVQTGVATANTTILGLKNGTTYYFKVAAVNAGGASDLSNEASATPLAVPAQVVGLTAVPGNAQAQLTWSSASGASSYIVYQSTASGAEIPVATGVSGTSYTATGLSNGTNYYFRVAGTNTYGTGLASVGVSATPVGGTVATPTFTPASGSYNAAQSVSISDTTPGASIYYSTDGSTPSTSSTRYTVPITVTSTTTLQAIAVASGYSNSAVSSASFTIASAGGGTSGGGSGGSSGGSGGGGAIGGPMLLGLAALGALRRRRRLARAA